LNIEKLAKHLKEFTLDEIEMIAEDDCKTELERLLNEHKLSFNNGLYKYIEQENSKTFELNQKPIFKNKNKILFKDFSVIYLNNKKLTKNTLKGYKSQLKFNILPNFGDKFLKEITTENINTFMMQLKEKYKPKTASNGVTLLGSILKYAFEQGYIRHNPYLGVKNSKCR
jgi:hypothetical protein